MLVLLVEKDSQEMWVKAPTFGKLLGTFSHKVGKIP
jgi:hypothetical protein